MAICKRKWCTLFAHRPTKFNKSDFFNEISNTMSKSLNNDDSIAQAGDLTIFQIQARILEIICLINYMILT